MRFVFVAQSGVLEIKAAILAASLRAVYGEDAELIAALPEPESDWGQCSARTLAFLMRLGVETAPINQPLGTYYPIANKIAALGVAGTQPVVLLDSDILCLNRARLFHANSCKIAAKPADLLSFRANEDIWTSIYERRGLRPPTERVTTTVSRIDSFPYYNSGVVYAVEPLTLAKRWMEYCLSIAADARIPRKGRWLDQISLPLAVTSLAWQLNTLSEDCNFPAHLKEVPSAGHVALVHYHSPEVLGKQRLLARVFRGLLQRYPALCEIISHSVRWTDATQPSESERLCLPI
jgi:hypothetical protein